MKATEVLEKGRKPAPIGTRKIQVQKRQKNGKLVLTHMWMKKTYRGWEYDGMVSPAEKKAYDAVHKKKQRSIKKLEQSKKKIQDALDEKNEQGKNKDNTDYKPSQSEIDKMPTKEKLYWSDSTTKARRELCDITGILTMDDISENYVRDNLKKAFIMNAQQKDISNNMSGYTPLDTDGKAFDDPIFMADTLANLKAMKQSLLSDAGKKNRDKVLEDDWNKLDSWGQDQLASSLTEFQSKVNNAIEDRFDSMIEAIEKNENDKVILNKLHAWDKGVRATGIMSKLHFVFVENLFGDLSNLGNRPSWDDIPEAYKNALINFGVTRKGYIERRWGLDEIRSFALASVNDDFRNTVLQPWLEVAGNVSYQRTTYPSYYHHGGEVEVTLPATPINTISSLEFTLNESAKKTQAQFNKLSVQFMQDSFKFNDVFITTDLFKQHKDEWYALAKEKRERIAKELRDNNGSLTHSIDIDVKSGINDVLTRYGFRSGSQFADVKFGLNPNTTWRDLANGLKSMSRRKGFTNTHPAILDAVLDAGKALGQTSIHSTSRAVEHGFNTIKAGITSQQDRLLKISKLPEFNPKDTITTSAQGKSYYSPSTNTTLQTFFDGVAEGEDSVDKTSKKSGQGLIYYGTFRKSSSKWKAGKFTATRAPFGTSKGPKSANKAKMLSTFGTLRSHYGQNQAETEIDNHISSSVKLAMGMNWQLRKMTKDDDIIPDWKWNPSLIPFGSQNKLSTTQKITVSPSRSVSGLTNKFTSIGPDYTAGILKSQYEASVASTLGLSKDKLPTDKSKQKPQIVLSVSKQSTDEVQKKIDKEWTHDKAVRGAWARGSVVVNHVFDINYHEYYQEYKKIEATKGNVQYGYHGTDFKAASSIMKGGYIVPRSAKAGRMLGDGVYIAKSSSKSCQYLHEGSFSRHGNTGVLLWNRIAMGNVTDPLKPLAGMNRFASGASKYDTVYAGGLTGADPSRKSDVPLQHDEWCVKNPKAVVPIQWIEVTTK